MIDAEELAVNIARLEYEQSSWPNYAKLADLYAIRDHMERGEQPQERGYSFASGVSDDTIDVDGKSDFLLAVDGKPTGKVLQIMDDLMSTLSMVNERAYNSVMRQIRELY